ncbi:unnamed protein product, partial [Prorocentrum cordatum]
AAKKAERESEAAGKAEVESEAACFSIGLLLATEVIYRTCKTIVIYCSDQDIAESADDCGVCENTVGTVSARMFLDGAEPLELPCAVPRPKKTAFANVSIGARMFVIALLGTALDFAREKMCKDIRRYPEQLDTEFDAWSDDSSQEQDSESGSVDLFDDVLEYEEDARGGALGEGNGFENCALASWKNWLVEHLKQHHQKRASFVPYKSNKMFRIAKAIHDSDQMRGISGAKYLQRAAALVRRQASTGLSKRAHTHLDEHMVLVLEEGGPRYYLQSELCQMSVRRVGDCYSTREFYNRARERLAGLLAECEDDGELQWVSIDGAAKPAFTLVGQASCRAPRWVREDQAVPIDDQLHVVLTMRVRSGAVLLATPVQTENAENVCSALSSAFSASQLALIQCLVTDDPSAKLLDGLQDVCGDLKAIALDCCHLAMVYEQANWEKKSPGSIDIRRIVAELEAKCGAGPRGGLFDGTSAAASTRGEKIARGGIGRKRLAVRKAKRVLGVIDVSKPFQTRTEVLRCREAAARVHHREMKKTLPSGKTRLQMLKCAAQPERLEWMLNAARVSSRMTREERVLLPA